MLCFNFTDKPETFDTEIDAGDGQTFTLVGRYATCEERIADSGLLNEIYSSSGDARQDAWKKRCRARLGFVIGWKGVNAPNGKPHPFSVGGLLVLISKLPQITKGVNAIIDRAFVGDEDAEKKSDDSSAGDQNTSPISAPNTESDDGSKSSATN